MSQLQEPSGPKLQRFEDMRPVELTVLCWVSIPSALVTIAVRWLALGVFDIPDMPIWFHHLTVAGGVAAAVLFVAAAAALFRRGGPLLQLAWWLVAADALVWTGLSVHLVVAMADSIQGHAQGGVGALAFPIGAAGILRGVWSALKLALGAWAIVTLNTADVRAWLHGR